MKNLQQEELDQVTGPLVSEFISKFTRWNEEYASQERDLGAVGEMVNLWRKAKKARAAVLDGADTSVWREPLRVVLFEIICHAFLLIFDLDKQASTRSPVEEAENLVPHCGHPRCIDHVHVPFYELNAASQALYLKEKDVVGNAADTG